MSSSRIQRFDLLYYGDTILAAPRETRFLTPFVNEPLDPPVPSGGVAYPLVIDAIVPEDEEAIQARRLVSFSTWDAFPYMLAGQGYLGMVRDAYGNPHYVAEVAL